MIRRDRPLTLTVSPPCTLFPIANQGPLAAKDLEEAKELIIFAVERCNLQFKAGRHFVLEQPLTSRAWSVETVMKLMITEGVISTDFHQCMYGLAAVDNFGPAPAYKPTRVLSSHPALAEALTRRCDGSHRHAQLVGKSACSRTAQYPHDMCKAILKALDVIKKSRVELSSYLASGRGIQGGVAILPQGGIPFNPCRPSTRSAI